MGFFKFFFVAFALPSIVHALTPITCDSRGWLKVEGSSEECDAVADEMNKVGTRNVQCDNPETTAYDDNTDIQAYLYTGEDYPNPNPCNASVDVLNKFPVISGVDCEQVSTPYDFNRRTYFRHTYFLRVQDNCDAVAANMNQMLAVSICNGNNGEYQPDGTCKCTDPADVGPDCEYSNAKTCSDAGVVDAAGQCTCTDPAIGVGPACEYSNAKTCSDAGVVDAEGRCTCTGPATGLGRTCSEYSNAKTCSDAGVVDGAGQCVCNDPVVGVGYCDCSGVEIFGDGWCRFSNARTCNDAGVVDAYGQCTCTDPAIGVGILCEYSNAKTCNDAGVVDAFGECTCNDRAVISGDSCKYTDVMTCSDAGVAQADGSCVCNDGWGGDFCAEETSINPASIIGPVLGGISALIGVIVLVVRLRHADNKCDEILIVCRCKDREAEDGMNTTAKNDAAPPVWANQPRALKNGQSKSTGGSFVAKATRILTKKLGRDPTDEEVAKKAKRLATKAANAAEGAIKINPAFVE